MKELTFNQVEEVTGGGKGAVASCVAVGALGGKFGGLYGAAAGCAIGVVLWYLP